MTSARLWEREARRGASGGGGFAGPGFEAFEHVVGDGAGGGGEDFFEDLLGDGAFGAGGDGAEEGDGGGAVGDVLDVGAGKAVELLGEGVEVEVVFQRAFAEVDVEHLAAGGEVGQGDVDLFIEASGAEDGGVELP